MVFPSIPVYLDPPNNWNNQQQIHHPLGLGGGGGVTHQLPPGLTAPRPESGMVRPGSMADRARLAKLPQPEHGLKCPRCDSSNTKFCYFNNYSHSQPRHFCKTCRRYWTRGGALRSVPVGGGCRRNKRSKSSSKSSSAVAAASSADHRTSSSSSTATCGGGGLGAIAHHMAAGDGAPTHLPLMNSLHPLTDYSSGNQLGLSFSGIQPIDSMEFQFGLSFAGISLQQAQHFPFLGGLDHPQAAPSVQPAAVSALLPFEGDSSTAGFVGAGSSIITQLSSVKMEDNNSHGFNLHRQLYPGLHGNDHQFWGSNGGGSNSNGNLSNFNSSSSWNVM